MKEQLGTPDSYFPDCPACSGSMWEHDIGYDECGSCEFYAIYDDGRQPPDWTRKELTEIYAAELIERKKYEALSDEEKDGDLLF